MWSTKLWEQMPDKDEIGTYDTGAQPKSFPKDMNDDFHFSVKLCVLRYLLFFLASHVRCAFVVLSYSAHSTENRLLLFINF